MAYILQYLSKEVTDTLIGCPRFCSNCSRLTQFLSQYIIATCRRDFTQRFLPRDVGVADD